MLNLIWRKPTTKRYDESEIFSNLSSVWDYLIVLFDNFHFKVGHRESRLPLYDGVLYEIIGRLIHNVLSTLEYQLLYPSNDATKAHIRRDQTVRVRMCYELFISFFSHEYNIPPVVLRRVREGVYTRLVQLTATLSKSGAELVTLVWDFIDSGAAMLELN